MAAQNEVNMTNNLFKYHEENMNVTRGYPNRSILLEDSICINMYTTLRSELTRNTREKVTEIPQVSKTHQPENNT